MRTTLQVLRSGAAIVAGYAVIVAGTTLGFETWLGGVGYHKSPLPVLAAAGAVSVLSGLAGGFTAARLAGRAPLLHAAGILLFLVVDTAVVLSRPPRTPDPLWFDLAGSATLMGSTLLGGWLAALTMRRPAKSVSPAGPSL